MKRNKTMPIILAENNRTGTSTTPHIRIGLRQAVLSEISLLDEQAEDFYSQLCYHAEPNRHWVTLPPHMQEEIDAKLHCHEIACLQVKGLIDVEVCG